MSWNCPGIPVAWSLRVIAFSRVQLRTFDSMPKGDSGFGVASRTPGCMWQRTAERLGRFRVRVEMGELKTLDCLPIEGFCLFDEPSGPQVGWSATTSELPCSSPVASRAVSPRRSAIEAYLLEV